MTQLRESRLQNRVVKRSDAPDALIAVNPLSISAIPFIDSPRTVTSCASGVQNFTQPSRHGG